MKKANQCKWTEDEDGIWHTDCDGIFIIKEGTPMLNDWPNDEPLLTAGWGGES